MIKHTLLLLSSSSLLAQVSDAFYLPGVSPKDYNPGDKIEMKVNKLTSSKTQLPYEYYKLPFCAPDPIINAGENLGEILGGDKIQNTLFDIKMNENESCKILCRKQYTEKEAKQFVEKIDEEYNVNLLLDGLPAATSVPISNSDVTLKIYEHGYRVGGIIILTNDDGKEKKGAANQHFLYNHIRITVKYHNPDPESSAARVVGLEIEPFSVRHKYKGKWSDENPPKICQDEIVHNFDGNYPQKIDGPTEVIWTYDVQWEPSNIKWASRWDVYLSMNNRYDDEVHWFSIINSLLIVIFLTGMVAMIMLRTLHRDLARYNMTEEEKAEEREETGWKLVHGDVFRPPNWPMLFSVTVGSGSQVFFMSFFTLFFSAIGYLSPARRGSLMIAILVCAVLLGIVAGYTSARTYKMFNGKNWQQCTLLTALFYPAFIFFIIFILDLVEWAEGSSAAIPFGSFVAIFALWFGISVPLTFLGAYFGYKRDVDELPVATQEIPRMIPDQPWYLNEFITTIVGGILPFGAVFVELFFILSSLWLDQFYYVFGFLLIVFFILLITCAEITIVLVYFQLCSEDYRWWWRSIFTSGSSAIYLFIYSAFYFTNKIESGFAVTAVLYFGYMFIISILFFLGTGIVGYYSSYWFIVKIFGSIKVD